VKQVFKVISSVAASLFLLYRSIELMKILIASSKDDLNNLEQTFIGAFLSILITGIVALPGFAMPTSRLLPKSYYYIKHPIKLQYWYKKLGVHFFKSLLLIAFWGKDKNRKQYFDGTRSGFKNLIYQSKQSEFGHLIPFIALTAIAIICLLKGFWISTLIIMVINIIGNLYPIPLQRMHRYRIKRMQSLYIKRTNTL
jgi:hypothetical protein